MSKSPPATTDSSDAATPEAGAGEPDAGGVEARPAPTPTRVRWDDSRMTTTYANVCNVSSTREEMTLLFGTNQTWQSGQEELTVALSDRIIVNPHAAKRMALLLANVVEQYESRFGALELGTQGAAQG